MTGIGINFYMTLEGLHWGEILMLPFERASCEASSAT
jgi:hypothetical protein